MTARSLLRLEVLAPAILGLAFAADVGLRLLPTDAFAFRAWEAMRVRGEDAPFRPSHRYSNPRTFGDLANLGNVRDLREYRAERVRTDALGYRNPPGLAESGRVRALLLGSSFSAATEVADHETLSARLQALTGIPVYNAGVGEKDVATIRGLARRLGLERGVVIYEYLDSDEVPPLELGAGVRRVGRCPRALAARAPEACPAYNRLVERWRVSPLHILSRRLLRALQDDRWLPNPDAQKVLRARLWNGRDMLFLAGDPTWIRAPGAEQRAARYFGWLAAKLSGDGLRLLVVLVPRKFTVYGPLFAAPDPRPDDSARHLVALAAELRALGLPAIDLTAPLRQAAAAATASLAEGRYLYFLDDTHWNAAGIALAAELVAPHLRALRPPDRHGAGR